MNPTVEDVSEALAEEGFHIPKALTNRKGQTLEGLLKESLRVSNRAGNTVAHAICGMRSYLQILPRGFLTKEILSIRNLLGGSAAHFAGLCGTLNLIDPALLTSDVVEQEDNFGGNLLHYAAEGLCLRAVPLQFLTPYNLFRRKDSSGKTPFSLTASRNLDHIPWEEFRESKWLPFLDELRVVSRPPYAPCPALSKFVMKVEAFNRIKCKARCAYA